MEKLRIDEFLSDNNYQIKYSGFYVFRIIKGVENRKKILHYFVYKLTM